MLPGHTHEDIDGVFSLVATSLASAADIQTPADIRRRVLHSLSPLFAKRGWNFTVEMVDTVRDWAAMAPSTVTFKNCFKIRQQQDESDTVPVPHSFNFMARQDMPGQGHMVAKVERVPRALKSPADSARDVFVMVKSRMSSDTLCQDPLLCWPGSLQSESQRFLNTANSATCPKRTWQIESDRCKELDLLRRAIIRDFPHMHRTGSWYESMLDGGPENVGTVPDLSFLKNAPTAVKDLVMTGTPAKRLTTLVPNSSTDEFYLPLYCFDYSPTGKNGLITKFPYGEERDGTRIITDASVGLCDELGYVTAEKTAPSPIGIVADISEAIKIHRRMSSTKIPLKDAMTKVIADYNRLTSDFSRRASKEFSQKAKAKVFQFIQFCQVKPIRLPALPLPLQKSQQLDEEGQILLHDTACLWIWLSSKLKGMFSSETMDKFQKLFDEGKSAKKEEEPDPSIKKEEDDSDAEKDEGKDDDEEILLRDMRYKLDRLLDFRDLPAFQVSPTKTSNPLPHMGRAFTDVQELRQDPLTKDRAEETITRHNEEYNKDGVADDDLKAEEPPRKRIKVENCTHEHVSTLTNVHKIQVNSTCDIMVGGDTGQEVVVCSRGRNQFFDKRELLLGLIDLS
ncbi:Uncharacterized protein SCF082_LOCUS44102 [Durusdinium trenchii]|uniref:DUF7869 domain-containing protein n=1 Tax=Durusdinium trenchii TaxID=1381693 RepID=A0ABP0R1S6_9DINO